MQKEYFSKIDASLKGFYSFENSSHSPPYEEQRRFIELIVVDVLNGAVSLAD